MKRVWKWTLDYSCYIPIPKGAQLLDVQEQREEPQLWALVDPEAETVLRHFVIFGTDHTMPDDPGTYVGTYQLRSLDLVFHVFEVD